jgi:hypothetical protein
MIEVQEEQDGSFTISWDHNDPVESQMNDWTQQDFIDAIMEGCNKIGNQYNKQLEEIAAKLGGKLEHYVCSDLHNEHEKYVISYNHKKR